MQYTFNSPIYDEFQTQSEKDFCTAMKTGSLRRFKQYPTKYMCVKPKLMLTELVIHYRLESFETLLGTDDRLFGAFRQKGSFLFVCFRPKIEQVLNIFCLPTFLSSNLCLDLGRRSCPEACCYDVGQRDS